MNRKQLGLLIVVLLVVGGAGLLLMRRNQETWSAPEGKLGQKLFADFPLNDVAAIRIKADTDLNLVRKDDVWKVQERGDYPANFQQISELLIKMGDLKIGQSDEVSSSDLARLHLEEPGKGADSATLVEFKNAQGKPIDSLLVGKKHMRKSERPMPGPYGNEGFPDGRFVMLKSDPKTVLTISDPLNSIEAKPTEWLNRDFFKIEKPKTIIFVSTNASNSWTAARAAETGPWLLANVKPSEMVDSNKLSSFSSAMTYPSFVDVATNSVGDHPLLLTVETFDHFTYVMKIGAKTPENNYYFNVAVSADLPAQRTAGKDEKPEEKTKLDKEFQDGLKASQERLKQEQGLAKWTYLVNNWLIDPLIRDRAQLMVEKPAPGATNAPPESAAEPATETLAPMDAPKP